MRDTRTALLLADGDGERWGRELHGEMLVQRAHRALTGFFDEILVVAPDPEPFRQLGYEAVADEYPQAGLLGGLATGLKHVGGLHAFAAGADMPFLHPRVARHLYSQRNVWDVVVSESRKGFEPLCAVYSKACIAPMEERIHRGNLELSVPRPERGRTSASTASAEDVPCAVSA